MVDLKQQIPDALPIFCYPTGSLTPLIVKRQRAVRAAGLVGAYTMVPGINEIGRTDPYLLRRVGMVAGQAPLHFKIRIGASGRLYRRSEDARQQASAPNSAFSFCSPHVEPAPGCAAPPGL